MTARGKFLLIGAGLLVLGLVAMFFIDSRGPEPELVCVSETSASSGFVDHDQDDCPISIESYNEWSEWNSSPRWSSIAGLALILGGLVVGIIGLFKRPRAADRTDTGVPGGY